MLLSYGIFGYKYQSAKLHHRNLQPILSDNRLPEKQRNLATFNSMLDECRKRGSQYLVYNVADMHVKQEEAEKWGELTTLR